MANDGECVKTWLKIKNFAEQYEIEIIVTDEYFIASHKIENLSWPRLFKFYDVHALFSFMQGYDLRDRAEKEDN